MKRKEFLKGLGLAGAAAFVQPVTGSATSNRMAGPMPPNCTLIPSETAGPFPLDLTENQVFFRQDVREDREGVRLDITLRIIGVNNCLPMQNTRVNIWHCDKDGKYSGYSNAQNPGQAGLTYLRGYQWTDADGLVHFTTIFPGWYTGRICHIHFQVWVSSVYAAISQLTFPLAEKNAVYAAYPALYTKGADPLAFNQDNIFSDGYTYQLATLTEDPVTGGYSTYLEIAVQGDGITGLAQAEPETGGLFTLGQNYPNPFGSITTVPFSLAVPAEVSLEMWSLDGKRVAVLDQGSVPAGSHTVEIDLTNQGLARANYVYQLLVNSGGVTYRKAMVMTAG